MEYKYDNWRVISHKPNEFFHDSNFFKKKKLKIFEKSQKFSKNLKLFKKLEIFQKTQNLKNKSKLFKKLKIFKNTQNFSKTPKIFKKL